MNNSETNNIVNDLIIEALTIISEYDLMDCLSEKNREIASHILEHFDQTESTINNPKMKLSPEEHMNLAYNVLELNHLQSSFWQYVVKINWLMMAVEKDQKLSSQVIQSGDMLSFYQSILK